MAKIDFNKITYNQMLKAFMGFNVVIIFVVLIFINSSIKIDKDDSAVKGDNSIKTQEQLDTIKTKDYETPLSKISFKYPVGWGLAETNSKASVCSEETLIEDITFSEFENFIVTINACNLAQDSFLNENEFTFTNDQKSIKFIGNFETNYKYPGYSTLSLKSTTSNKPLILIKVLFDEKVTSKEQMRESTNLLIKSLNFN